MAGRPSKFKKAFVETARAICELGGTNEELAESLEVSIATVNRWMHKYPEFCFAVKRGKEAADDRVERSLYQRAVGYTATETQQSLSLVPQKDGSEALEVTREKRTRKYIAPDPTACIFWLKNRRPEDWRDRVEHVGKDGGPIEYSDLSDMEIARRMVSLLDRATHQTH